MKATTLGTLLFPIVVVLLAFATLIVDVHHTDALVAKHSVVDDAQSITRQVFGFFAGGQLPSVFTENEASHMQDVKVLIRDAFLVLLLTGALFIYAFVRGERKKIVRNGTILLTIVLLLAIIIPFGTLFTQFHHIFFPQGNWMFAADSMLIQLYPQSFFMQYARDLLLSIFVIVLGCFAIAR